MTKYQCSKCKDIVDSKSNIPLEHGKTGFAIHPEKSHSIKCEGVYNVMWLWRLLFDDGERFECLECGEVIYHEWRKSRIWFTNKEDEWEN